MSYFYYEMTRYLLAIPIFGNYHISLYADLGTAQVSRPPMLLIAVFSDETTLRTSEKHILLVVSIFKSGMKT